VEAESSAATLTLEKEKRSHHKVLTSYFFSFFLYFYFFLSVFSLCFVFGSFLDFSAFARLSPRFCGLFVFFFSLFVIFFDLADRTPYPFLTFGRWGHRLIALAVQFLSILALVVSETLSM